MTQVKEYMFKDFLHEIWQELESSLDAHNLIVVNADDLELTSYVSKCLSESKKICGGASRWLDYPGIGHSGRSSIVIAGANQPKADDALTHSRDSATLERLVTSLMNDMECVLLTTLEPAALQALALDLHRINIRSTHSWKIIAFCKDATSVPRDGKFVNIRLQEVVFEENVQKLLRMRWDEPDAESSVWSIGNGIAGLAECSVDAAARLLNSILSITSVDGVSKPSSEGLATFKSGTWTAVRHQKAVLKLLKARAPEEYLAAWDAGVLPEFVFGLQRASSTAHSSGRKDLASIFGEELPLGYRELSGDLSFMRWCEEITKPYNFTGVESVAAVMPKLKTSRDTTSEFLRRAINTLLNVVQPPQKDSTKSTREFDALIGFIEALGYNTGLAKSIVGGLRVMGGHLDLSTLLTITRLAEEIKNLHGANLMLSSRRDVRAAIALRFLAKQLVEKLGALCKQYQLESGKSATVSTKDANVGVRAPGGPRAWLKKAIRSVLNKFSQKSSDVSTQAGASIPFEDAFIDIITEVSDSFKQSAQAKRNIVVLKLQSALTTITDIELIHWSSTTLFNALDKLSRNTARKLDYGTEKLRFQIFLLDGQWQQAERLLEEFKLNKDKSAQISDADYQLFEAGMLEARGRVFDANRIFQKLVRQLDPTIDPVTWSRANYAEIRTQLALKGRPERAAMASALAFVDLENQRDAAKSLSTAATTGQAKRPKIFFSFRSSSRTHVGDWIEKLRTNDKFEAISRLDDDTDEGDAFDATLQIRLLQSECIVIVLSRDYFQSPWCINELHTALLEAQFNRKSIAWMFLNVSFDNDSLTDPESYIRAQFPGVNMIAIDTHNQYLEERLRRLMELGKKIGKGLYTSSDTPESIAADLQSYLTAIDLKN